MLTPTLKNNATTFVKPQARATFAPNFKIDEKSFFDDDFGG
jgi:hypothetical protein